MRRGKQDKITAHCDRCGGAERNHKVLRDVSYEWTTIDDSGTSTYQIICCLGCDAVRFRHEFSHVDSPPGPDGEVVPIVHVYPESRSADWAVKSTVWLPGSVARIYTETVAAFNAGARILAGAGLRAIVEAICLDQGVSGGNLQKKIDALVAGGLLGKPQADLLHEERYIGNTALHKITPPSKHDIEDGLQIVEGLLSTIYNLPANAKSIQLRRSDAENRIKNSRNKATSIKWL